MNEVDVMEELRALVEQSPEFSDCTVKRADEGLGFLIDMPREGRFVVTVRREEE